MKTTFYPTLEEALHLHRMLIERYGGLPGVRDLGLIESALYRPRSGYYETLSAQAAALLQSLAMNHGFVDGNKRVAMALTMIFLRINGQRLVVGADDAEEFLIERVIVGKAPIEEIASWLHERLSPMR
ncbi:MAG: type II toxin-antitoxin system death-on-curing family toxin [Deltaproteobacteria bacterium]|nr:MAG: type II toxin-antitoxin system death-on-curing family toxin [Deltaproteobacteria bacterium]